MLKNLKALAKKCWDMKDWRKEDLDETRQLARKVWRQDIDNEAVDIILAGFLLLKDEGRDFESVWFMFNHDIQEMGFWKAFRKLEHEVLGLEELK